MAFKLTHKTTFSFMTTNSQPIKNAIEILKRDFYKVFSSRLKQADNADVCIKFDQTIENDEQYKVIVGKNKITILCKDELSVVYAIFYISREFLGVDDFWFCADKEPYKKCEIDICEREFLSKVATVRYRGWFVNDEVCLIGWSKVYPPSREVWECVFETLLRLGGNIVIPGTDLPSDSQHFEIASEMGLYITHHHAQPLGGELFLRAYPNEEASYDTNKERFEKLWSDGIEKNKDKKIVWALGFRGQGNIPFWHNDPKYTTPQSRAEVIMRVIDRQYEMICEKVENPVCSVYLYGEITELYEAGYLKLPKHFIKIWSDNGYGKMVTRRCECYNPRIPSLPKEDGKHGVYYHITFHDLQASSHLTLLANPPEMVNDELDTAFSVGATEYLLLNCGNIRPHVYMVDLVNKKWNSGKVDIEEFKKDFAKRYFAGDENGAIECYNEYFKCTVKYGINDDDRAGDEFFHHPARQIITQWAKGNTEKTCYELSWATGMVGFMEQIQWFKEKCVQAIDKFEKLVIKCESVLNRLDNGRKIFFKDNIMFQAKIHLSGAKGFLKLCEAFERYVDKDYVRCFVELTHAIDEYTQSVFLMEESEHDKWEDFYSTDWLTNVRVTIQELKTLRGYIRLIDDGPDYFKWYKNNIIPEKERKIYLENTQRRTLDDEELADKLSQIYYKKTNY